MMRCMQCKKCGGSQFLGPRFERGGRCGPGVLRYVCLTCGYNFTTPTNDSPQNEDDISKLFRSPMFR